MMTPCSRRRFLGQMGTAAGALTLGPLRVLADPADPAGTAPRDPTAGLTDMSIARWDSYAAPDVTIDALARRLTEEAIGALGGMGRFVSKGDVVWIKPNMGWNRTPELAANTNPDVVATLVRLCLDAGAKKVRLGDNTCHNSRQCYQSSGVADAAEAVGAEIVQLDENRFREVKLGGERLEKWQLYPEIIESDLVINVPIAKHHGLSRVTLGMKNYMGVVGGRRNAWHQDLSACLCDITAYMKPRLTVLDAVRVLTANGPQGGNTSDVERLDTVVASTDIVALDAFGAELMGHEPESISTVRAAAARGLGTMSYRDLALRELVVS